MPFERRPRRLVPRGMVVPNSVPHRVQDGESWETLAERYGVSADQIIYANFLTLVPEEVNWYLRQYVGCTKPTRDGRNWMFSSKAKPGIIQIPPQVFIFEEPLTITGTPPPRYYPVTVDPTTWTPPSGMADGGASASGVVTRTPWEHKSLTVGGLTIKGRKDWGASEPTWKNEVIYYNTAAYPLASMLKRVIVHHTDNEDSIKEVESTQKGKGYAAIGYHFFIDQKGTIYEGRPLEIMGSNAGEGTVSGPTNDPDWGAIGITLQGDYHNADNWVFSDEAPKAQLQSLEDLVVALRKDYPIDKLLMHREVTRGGKPTVCPGDAMVPHVESLRTKLRMSGP
jgi:hypothetical protein